MAGSAPSFDDLIQADRKKRKAEALAQSMLGSRKTNNPAAGLSANRKGAGTPSLASRVGVTKQRTSSTGAASFNNIRNNESSSTNSTRKNRPSLPSSLSTSQLDRGNRLYASLQKSSFNASSQNGTNFRASTGTAGASMSIRGMASSNNGPFVVMASNFAPGTTAADIESAMVPVGGEIMQCRLLSARPTVLCEIVFKDREGAENVINTFNNQKADGRLLYVYMKQGGPTPQFNNATRSGPTRSQTATPVQAVAPPPPPAPAPVVVEEEVMEIDDEQPIPVVDQTPLGAQHEQSAYTESNTSRPREDGRLSRPDDRRDGYSRSGHDDRNGNNYQDGRYGFRESGGYDRRPPVGGGGYYGGRPRGGYNDRYGSRNGGYGRR